MTGEGTMLKVRVILVWLFFSGAQGGGSWRLMDVTSLENPWSTPSHLEGQSIHVSPAQLFSPAVLPVPLASSQPSQ